MTAFESAPQRQRAATLPLLILEQATGERSSTSVEADVTLIGRAEDCHLRLVDGRVSKRHAEVRRIGTGFVIADVGSRAGVFVNGKRVEECALSDGDVITLGIANGPLIRYSVSAATGAPSLTQSVLLRPSEHSARESLEKLGRFLEFNRLLGGHLNLTEILDGVVDMAVEITGAERGFLVLLQPGGKLQLHSARGNDRRSIPLEGAKVSETIVRQVLSERRTRVVSDVHQEEDLACVDSIAALSLGSSVALPLRRQMVAESTEDTARSAEEIFGVLYFDSRLSRDAFGSLDMGILETLARDAASAIENARLLRETEDKRRMDQELRTAREVQEALIPRSLWSRPTFAVAGRCIPCLELGGDLLGQLELAGDHAGFLVADVCGKGVPAALMAAALQGSLHAGSEGRKSLAEIVASANRMICRTAPEGRFITLLLAGLSPGGRLEFVNAGHCPLMVVRGGVVYESERGDIALGWIADATYTQQALELSAGDVALLFTDGVVESGSGDDLYGEARLREVLRLVHRRGPAEILDAILADVKTFLGSRAVRDDATVLVVKYLGG